MTLATKMQGVATKLINKFGNAAVTFTRATPGAFVPSTGALGSGSTLTYSGKVLTDGFTVAEVNNDTILYTDLKCTLGITTQVPAVNDTVVLGDGLTYRVMNVMIQSLQDTNIAYTLQLRV